jgi:hypothetical protein
MKIITYMTALQYLSNFDFRGTNKIKIISTRRIVMLASEKIAQAFVAIVEEAEKLVVEELSEEVSNGLKTIVSIARHQSDIRGARGGKCKPHSGCK